MAGINDYTLDVILRAKEEGMAAFAVLNARLAEMVAASELANRALEKMDARGEQHSQILRMISDDTLRTANESSRLADTLESKLTPALNRTSGSSNNASNGLYRFIQGILPGQTTAGNFILVIAGLSVVLAGLSGELAASLILFGAWVVGAAAFAATIGIVVGGLGLLVAGVAALGLAQMGGLDPAKALETAQKQLATATNQTEAAQEAVAKAQLSYDTAPTAMKLLTLQQAQEQLTESQQKQVQAQNAVNTAQAQANGPVGVLHQKIEDMAAVLGQKAIPMVNAMASALIPLVPRVQAAGESLMNWFGPRLPQVLQIAGQAFGNLAAGMDRVGVVWGQIIDRALARSPEFGNIINGAFNRVIDGAIGLMLNLEALSNWFVARLPTLGSNANSVFANIGTVIQAVGRGLGIFVDWIIANWPGINRAFDETWKVIQQGWAQVAPVFSIFGQTLEFLKPTLDDIRNHISLFKPLLEILVAVLLIAIAAVYAFMLVLIALGATLTVIAALITALVPIVGGVFSAIGTFFRTAVTQYQQAAKDIGSVFSALGSTVQTVLAAIGAFFSAVGSTVQAGLAVIGGFFSAVGTEMNLIVGIVGSTFGAIFNIVLTIGAIIFGAWLVLNQAIYTALIPIWNAVAAFIGSILTAIWGVIVQIWNAVLGFLIAVWTTIWGVAVERWTAITTNIATALTLLWTSVIQPIWNAVLAFLITIWTAISAIANAIWTAITGIITSWLNQQQTTTVNVWGQIQAFLIGAWNTINGLANTWWSAIWGTITGWAGNIRDTVQGIWNGMIQAGGNAMSSLGSAVKSGLNKVIDVFDNFINATNAALQPVIGHNAVAPIPHLATGGVIPGYAPGQDSVLAMLSPGEGVLTPQAVRGLGGASTIEKINSTAQLGAAVPTSGIFGQCVPYVEKALDVFWPVALAKQLTAYVNSQTAKAGEAAVFTGGAAGHVALVTGPGDGYSFPVIDSNWVAPLTVGSHTMNKGMYGFAGFIDTGHGPGGIAGLVGGVVQNLFGPIVDGALNAAKGLIPGVPAWIRDLPGPILDQLAGGVKGKFGDVYNRAMAPMSGIAATIGTAVNASGNVASWIAAAISATGVPGWWAPLLAVLVSRESGGNPNAINRTDSNAAAGHPSQGLAQVIPGTFAAYHQPGTSGNILDPVANLAAAINYIKARYGTILNVQQANALLPPRGYDSGGQLQPGLSYVYNGTGRAENVSSGDTMDRVIAVLQSIDTRLATLSGQPRLSGQLATQRNG